MSKHQSEHCRLQAGRNAPSAPGSQQTAGVLAKRPFVHQGVLPLTFHPRPSLSPQLSGDVFCAPYLLLKSPTPPVFFTGLHHPHRSRPGPAPACRGHTWGSAVGRGTAGPLDTPAPTGRACRPHPCTPVPRHQHLERRQHVFEVGFGGLKGKRKTSARRFSRCSARSSGARLSGTSVSL